MIKSSLLLNLLFSSFGSYLMKEVMEGFTRAAVRGSARAWDALGTVYETGKGAPASDAKACECWAKGAELGFAPSMFSLARRLQSVSVQLHSTALAFQVFIVLCVYRSCLILSSFIIVVLKPSFFKI